MKQLLVFLFLLCSASVFAQDVIVKKDGSTIVCRVVELTDSEITYKKWSDLNGSNYVMDRSLASAINYENGKKVNLSEATNLYTPNNQNDGTQQYNDRALLQLDYETQNPYLKKAKAYRTIGWIGGGVFVGASVILSGMCLTMDGYSLGGSTGETIAAVVCLGAGVGWTLGFQLLAKRVEQNFPTPCLASVARTSERWVIFEASLRLGVRKSLSLPHFKNNSIFSSLFISDCQNFCTFAPAFRKECKDILLNRLSITTARNEQTNVIGAAPTGRRFPIYICGLW